MTPFGKIVAFVTADGKVRPMIVSGYDLVTQDATGLVILSMPEDAKIANGYRSPSGLVLVSKCPYKHIDYYGCIASAIQCNLNGNSWHHFPEENGILAEED
jgi:hypothetical protein